MFCVNKMRAFNLLLSKIFQSQCQPPSLSGTCLRLIVQLTSPNTSYFHFSKTKNRRNVQRSSLETKTRRANSIRRVGSGGCEFDLGILVVFLSENFRQEDLFDAFCVKKVKQRAWSRDQKYEKGIDKRRN